MITYKDCPECGARKIHSTVRLCEVCETCERYESKIEESRRERDQARADAERMKRLLDHATSENPGTSTLVMLMNESRSLADEVQKLRSAVEQRDRGLVICHQELDELGAENDQMSTALRNVLMLSKRIRKTDPENAEHLVRFCREAGVEDSIVRSDQ